MDRRSFVRAGLAAGGALALAAQSKPKIQSSVMLWTLKGTFEQKLEKAAAAGVQSVELVAEHIQWTNAQVAEAKKRARSLKLGMDTIIATPDWKGRPVSMVKPAEREGFLKDVRQAIEWAKKLEIPQIILMSGDEVPGVPRADQYASLLEGTKRAGDLAAQAGVTLIVEPLNNKVDHRGFFLTNCVDGLQLVKEVNNPHVKLLFDLYHEQVQLGNVTRSAVAAAPWVAVYHVADNPGRNDPGTGEMNYANIYAAIKKSGYSGYVTMEYLPKGDEVTSLKKSLQEMWSVLGS